MFSCNIASFIQPLKWDKHKETHIHTYNSPYATLTWNGDDEWAMRNKGEKEQEKIVWASKRRDAVSAALLIE